MEATTAQAVELPRRPEHGTPPPESCRLVLEILSRIGDKWTVMVIGTLADGPMRFNAILRAISGISHRMLTLTLRSLEQDGLVKRTAYATIPPKVEYELTELGLSLIEPLRALGDWAVRNRPAIAAARAHFASLTAAQ
ncbi:winged helix-turn-helix transcriptional regulator [Ralstonia nicotianae]|uniref:Putative transcription regulator n=1 Tax=Ralstonia solanacearum TaxID=305 RepID=A0A0S4UTV3_RALSL|nr:helix-turn-helix domain-containing protein [Ralstonia pseudosolanacearum]CUV25695.1 putative transcription regulator [Ralstonia solanacearum]MBX9429152.1 helix-turn-helix transcriptional regulator [Ralstonia pseudosolanacearum]MCL1621862.1 helix-turn-helix transcriptional regulator [Ralstonia pseudosolanacearum CaRs-Mep]MCQ4678518.1 helix-turn-helix transcriptional regulator [Ralstonia pseudosolanacearum]CUV35458.1 putative transcription regulator [Ralstonia solanacearum]